MAKKVSKNQRTDRGKNAATKNMVKIVVSEKKPNGNYRFRYKMVEAENLQQELKAARA